MRQHVLILGIALAALFTGCKKYEDGGTYKSAEKNITQTWTLNKVFRNNLEILNRCGLNADSNGFWCKQILSFLDNGAGSLLWTNPAGIDSPGTFTWFFLEEKSKVYISFYEGGNFNGIFSIKRLGKKSFHIQAVIDDVYDLEFTAN